jgi:hypothetical protein
MATNLDIAILLVALWLISWVSAWFGNRPYVWRPNAVDAITEQAVRQVEGRSLPQKVVPALWIESQEIRPEKVDRMKTFRVLGGLRCGTVPAAAGTPDRESKE